MNKKLLFAIIAIFVLSSIGIGQFSRQNSQTTNSIVSRTSLDLLVKKDASSIDLSHLAPDLVPPTNKWFSGLALQKTPKTVFPTPLSFTPDDTSFSIALPTVETSKDALFAALQDKVTVRVVGATRYSVTRYDELSVDLTYRTDTRELGTVTITAGSPYVYFHAVSPTTLTVQSADSTLRSSSTVAQVTSQLRKTVVAGFDDTKLLRSGTNITAALPAGGLTTFYSLPASLGKDPLLDTADSRITGGAISYDKVDTRYRTSLRFSTSDGQDTYYGALPHHATAAKAQLTYETIYGEQRMIKSNRLVFDTPAIPVEESLDLAKISKVQKAFLVTTLRRDINATQITASDTYFGGKELYRSAQLLDLAEQLGERTIATSIHTKLRNELTTWLTPGSNKEKSFYYDSKLQGIVGETAAFGSEEFNDHHFHYGYFIYAASILAKYDADFLQQYETIVNLIVADIANYRSNEQLPLRRSYDPYFGHSWASGSAPFNDGNNQESVSEAINAWTAVWLWAQQTHNAELATEAGWMLSNEVESKARYWMNFNSGTTPYNQGYAHSLVSLNWGGKRDYATFFSAEPNAQLGILLIPLNPTMRHLASYGDRIGQHVGEAISNGNYNVQFGDYILMYSALRSTVGALEGAKALPDEVIDGANSRSYLYAWILSVGR